MEHTKISFLLKWVVLLAAILGGILIPISGLFAASGDDLALALRNNVVKVTAEWNGGHTENGFGFIVGERGGDVFIATANHVVRRRGVDPFTGGGGPALGVRIEYFSRRGEIFEATLLATSSVDDDLAVLRAPSPENLSWRKQAVSSVAAERSMPVWFIGRAGDWYVPSSPGAVNNIGLDKRIATDDLNVQVGTSGAPLVGEYGILGMIVEEAGGIAYALPVDFIEQAFRFWNHPWQLASLPDSGGGGTDPERTCRITGLVFDSESNRPLAGVWLDLYRNHEAQNKRPERLQAGVATTGPDGLFTINCGGVADSAFPLLLAVRHRDWVATRITGQSIAFKDQWDGVNIALAMSSIDLKEQRADSAGEQAARDFDRAEAQYKRGQFRTARPLLEKAAEAGNGKAAYYLGDMYLNGRGVTKSETEAVKWIRRSAAAGEGGGLFLMGTIYARGMAGLDQNNRSALAFYHRAADAGYEGAYWQLGIRYERGIGVKPDVREAIAWYGKAAKAGNELAREALTRLGAK